MIISPTPPTPPPAAVAAGSRRHRRVRRSVALAAAGGLLTGLLGLTSVSTAAGAGTTLVADWSYGAAGGFGRGGSDNPWSAGGESSDNTETATADSSAAGAAESKGVALIDTVLSNGQAAGTGIVLTSDGEVLTNYHVVEGSTSIRVTIANTGKTYTATVVGHDQTTDIALLQLKNASGLAISRIDDDTVKTGDDVTAVGNAGGTGELSAADGTITDLSTSLTTASEGGVAGERLRGMLQTDADVVAGDSGGPLIDAEGEVVGIDTAASTGQEIDGYAIPIDTALAVVTQILSGTETTAVQIGPSAFLGVELASGYADEGSSSTGGDSTAGALIAGVVDAGTADRAGITAGDTITKLGTKRISDAADLSTTLAGLDPGHKITLSWATADGSSQSATVVLGSSPLN